MNDQEEVPMEESVAEPQGCALNVGGVTDGDSVSLAELGSKKLAQQSSIKRSAEETLRLINGDYPLGEPRSGDMIKIVQ